MCNIELKATWSAIESTVPDVSKVKASQEQFETLSQFISSRVLKCSDTLMQIAAQQLVHLQHYRSLSTSYKELVFLDFQKSGIV